MSDAFRKNCRSFMPYNPNRQDCPSVDNSTDLMRPNRFKVHTSIEQFLPHQSTDQPYSSNLFFFPFSSYDGIQNEIKVPQIPSFNNNNSVDSRQQLKPSDVILSQSKFLPYLPFMFFSPRQSVVPNFQMEPQVIKSPHFKKEELKLLKEEQSSEQMKIEESSWEEKPPKPIKKRIKKHQYRDEDSSESYRVCKKKKTHKINDTKNITKNYSKAIISYIINNSELLLKFMIKQKYDDFVNLLKSKKNQMTNIKQLRDLWVDGGKNIEFNKVFRIISQHFLRKQAVAYVYNSRISNTAWHLKYRYNLLRALHEPENFKFIKDI